MRLFYRGTTFEYDPTQAPTGNTGRPTRPTPLTETPYTLLYRGTALQVDPLAPTTEIPAGPDFYNLYYRGTVFHVSRTSQGDMMATAKLLGRKANAQAGKLNPAELAKVHRTHMLENLQHRLQVAKAQGNQALVDLLENERQQILA